MEAVNDIGNMSSFINCVFAQSLNAKGSNTNLNNCTINGALNVSGNEVTLTASTVVRQDHRKQRRFAQIYGQRR